MATSTRFSEPFTPLPDDPAKATNRTHADIDAEHRFQVAALPQHHPYLKFLSRRERERDAERETALAEQEEEVRKRKNGGIVGWVRRKFRARKKKGEQKADAEEQDDFSGHQHRHLDEQDVPEGQKDELFYTPHGIQDSMTTQDKDKEESLATENTADKTPTYETEQTLATEKTAARNSFDEHEEEKLATGKPVVIGV